MMFTVLGAQGFIGSELSLYLEKKGHTVFRPKRNDRPIYEKQLGHVVYAIGVTSDFRTRMKDTLDAHINTLYDILHHCQYDSFLYLSSTRVYGLTDKDEVFADESEPISVLPNQDSIYDISKLLGEAICVSRNDPKVKIVRLSNVCGRNQAQGTFLKNVMLELIEKGKVVINETPLSSKNYINIEDVVWLMERIVLDGNSNIYNVASDKNITHNELANILTDKFGGKVLFNEKGVMKKFKNISINRLIQEFQYRPTDPFSNLFNMND